MAAHIFRSPRFDIETTNTPEKVGPGTYTHDLVVMDYRKAYAPFSHKAPRFTSKKSDTPGPGAYNNPKIPYSSTTLHPLSSFSSRAPRLRSFEPENEVPGPGEYEAKSYWGKRSFRIDTGHEDTTPTKIEFSPYKSSPSIPSTTEALGYEEGEGGKLRAKKAIVHGYSGKGTDTVGPNSYNIAEYVNHQNFDSKPKFQFTRAPRSYQMTDDNPGAGTYNPVFPGDGSRLILPSSVFKSTTERTFLTPNNTPGPGSYSVKSSVRGGGGGGDEGVQSFGVLAPRGGVLEMAGTKDKDMPGPGTYEEVRQLHPLPPVAHPFSSTASRFPSEQLRTLGPGQYHPKMPSYKPVTHTASAFNTLSSRDGGSITVGETPDVVGPGAYTQQDSLVTLFRKQQASSSFVSSQERFIEKPNEVPGPGHYNPVGSSLKVDPQVTVSGRELPTSSFLGPPRGGNAGGGISFGKEERPGPGNYDLRGNLNVKGPDVHSGFMSTDVRFKDKIGDVPGVGTYELEGNVLKRSFNRTIKTEECK